MDDYQEARNRGPIYGLIAVAIAAILGAVVYVMLGGGGDGGPDAVVLPTPSTIEPARVVERGPADRRAVTLTFDAESDTGFTQEVLDTLEANGIIAAFGVTGRWADENQELVVAIVNAGHALINHTYDHHSFTGSSTGAAPLSQEDRWEQLDRTEALIVHLTGRLIRPYFRPPHGDYDDSVNRDAGLRGYAYNVMWTIDSLGWQRIPTEEIVTRSLALAEPGAIYLFHVGSESNDAEALQSIIDGLRQDGYELVPLHEMVP